MDINLKFFKNNTSLCATRLRKRRYAFSNLALQFNKKVA